MSRKSKPLRVFVSSCETHKEDGKPALVPRLRFPEFREAEGWTEEKLGSKTKKVGSGITPTGGEKNYKQSGRPFVRSQNVGWGGLLLDDVAFIDEETHNSFSSTQIETFDVLLNITGASIGRSAVADARIEGGNVNQHVCIIRVKPDELSPYFLNQYLISQDGQKQIDSFQAGGNRQGLNFEQIRSFLIPLPKVFAEQQKIAECLSSVDELIAAQARKLDALKTHKKGLMQQLFPREGETQPRLRFPEFLNAGEWEGRSIGQLGEVVTGSTPSTAVPAYYGGDRQFVSPADISDGRFIEKTKTTLTELGFQETRPIRANSILFVCIGSTIGKVAQNRHECATNQQINSVVPNSNNCDAFVYYALSGLTDVIANLAGIQAVPIVNKSIFSSVELVLPKLPEQQRIADCLTTLDDLIAAQTQKHEALKTHKKGLMQQLFPTVAGASSSNAQQEEQDAPATP